MTRYYVAGAGGMLGDAIYRVMAPGHVIKCTDVAVDEDWVSCCDFRDRDAYARSVNEFEPDVLLHVGALTDLEQCELNPEEAYRTNAEAVAHAVSISQAARIPLVYISTAGIFDGGKEEYDDWSEPNPIGVYAKSKHLGELTVQSSAVDYLICRAGWMMGGGPRKDKKFVNKFCRQIWNGKRYIDVVTDKFGSPTYTLDFARNLSLLLESGARGLFNMACSESASRFDVASEILDALGLRDQVALRPVSSAHLAQDYFAPRPTHECIRNRKLEEMGLDIMRPWRPALREYLEASFAAPTGHCPPTQPDDGSAALNRADPAVYSLLRTP